MHLIKRLTTLTLGVAFATLPMVASAQTPDGYTPAEEVLCDTLSGAQYGLCNAICEAQDCPGANGSGDQCTRLLSNWQKHSPFFEPPCYLNACERKAQEAAQRSLEKCGDVEDYDKCESEILATFYERRQKECAGYVSSCEATCDKKADSVFAECFKGGDFWSCAPRAQDALDQCYAEQGEKCAPECTKLCQDKANYYECSALCLDPNWDGYPAKTDSRSSEKAFSE